MVRDMSETHIHRTGIVDTVQAMRKKGQVVNLRTTIRFETEVEDSYAYEDKNAVDEVMMSLPAHEGVNPGDVVIMNISFKDPMGRRFQPALEVGENPFDELDEDDYNEAVIDAGQDGA